MKQSGHLNPSEATRTRRSVTSKYGRTPSIKHGCVGRQQQHNYTSLFTASYDFRREVCRFHRV